MSNDEQIQEPEVDNLEAAMHQIAETLTPTVQHRLSTRPGTPATKQVLIRVLDEDHARWKAAGDLIGMNMSEFIRTCVNDRTRSLLDCEHPLADRRWFPWAEHCQRCGRTLRQTPND